VTATPATSASSLPRPRPAPVSLRHLLFPTDLSPESENAFSHAKLLAERFGSRVTLQHVVELPDHSAPYWLGTELQSAWERAERLAAEELQRLGAGLAVPHEVVVERRASTHRAVVERIQALHPDLVVMATHGRDGLAHLFLGSVAEKVVQHGRRPVLCVRHGSGTSHAPGYKRILVPTDFSFASGRAFPLAGLLARAFEAEVLALHVAQVRSAVTVAGVPEPVYLSAPRLSEAALWQYLQADFSALPVTAHVAVGRVWERIVETAATERADLVVMATRGHDSLEDRILGSNTERVVRHAHCPVLVV
jgi:nucleotide-binding universal stress UspA family protein